MGFRTCTNTALSVAELAGKLDQREWKSCKWNTKNAWQESRVRQGTWNPVGRREDHLPRL